jgi:hypothetical protein
MGPIVENCHLEGMGDDLIAVSSSPGIVMADASGTSVTVAVSLPLFRTNDAIRLFRASDGVMTSLTVLAVSPSSMTPVQIQAVVSSYYPSAVTQLPTYTQAVSVALSSAVTINKGDLVGNSSRSGDGYVIRKNYLSNTRARGIIVKASDGIIEENVISHTALPGILLNSEAGAFLEAGVVRNVNVRRNVLDHVNESWQGQTPLMHAGGITIIFEDTTFLAHKDINIEDNILSNTGGLNIQVNNASDISINRNVFVGSHQYQSTVAVAKGADHSSLVWCDRVNGVTLGTGTNANYYYDMGAYGVATNTVSKTTNSLNVSGEVYSGD